MLILSLFSFHLIQIRELEPLLCHSDSPSQLIWTSSRNARKSNFHLEDIQHSSGQEPYSSSKYAIDLLSVALNRNFNPRVRPGRVTRGWRRVRPGQVTGGWWRVRPGRATWGWPGCGLPATTDFLVMGLASMNCCHLEDGSTLS